MLSRSPLPLPGPLPRAGAERRRAAERGSAMLLAMIVLTALATMSGLAAVTVTGGLTTSTSARAHALAVYAAESGGAAALDFLRQHLSLQHGWTAYVSPGNSSRVAPDLPGNGAAPGAAAGLLSADTQGWYEVEILNNRGDPGFAAGQDADARVIVRATGHGPNGALAVLEWDISGAGALARGRPCPGYGQKGMGEDGAGRNDCLGAVSTAETALLRPGG